MSILVYGRDKVKNVERALGGTPPAKAIEKSRGELERFVAKRLKSGTAGRAQTERVWGKNQRVIAQSMAHGKAGLKDANDQLKRIHAEYQRLKLDKPKLKKIEPRILVGSNFVFHAPPYDTSWGFSSDGASADANATSGSYDLSADTYEGGTESCAAGVASSFFSVEENPSQRFAVFFQYSDTWYDNGWFGMVAHNDFRTRIWIWGSTEDAWVVQADVNPSWIDAAGWFDTHGNAPDGETASSTPEIFFPAQANSWYLCWVWSWTSVDSNGGPLFGGSMAGTQFSGIAQFMVFGSL